MERALQFNGSAIPVFCDLIEENYQDYKIVFSGRKGFHVLLPFHARIGLIPE